MKHACGISIMVLALLALAMSAMAADGTTLSTTPTVTATVLPDSLPMIGSRLALFSYAKGQVASAQKWISCSGILTGKTYASVNGSDPDVRKILASIVEDSLQFGMPDTSLRLTFGISLADSAGVQLFSGQNQFNTITGSDGWAALPYDADNVVLEMAKEIPISMPGITSAVALVKQPGQTVPQWVPLNVWSGNEGRLFFPTSLTGLAGAGWSGELVVYTGGNTPTVYDMTTGASVDPVMFNISGKATLKNIVFLDDPSIIHVTPESVNGRGINPLYQITISVERTIGIYAETMEGEVATGVYICQSGDAEAAFFSTSVGALPFLPGVYDVWFVYPEFGNDEPVIPPYGGGGMG